MLSIKYYLKRMKYKLILGVCLGLVILLCPGNKCFASTRVNGVESFPDSYKSYLYMLNRLHQNWTFTALNTNLDWNEVISTQGPNTNLIKSLVHISLMDLFKWKDITGSYNYVETNFVTASELGVKYSMDPRNYLNEIQIFQFESLDYDANLQTRAGVEKILYGTLMYNRNISYIDINGNICNLSKTYSDVIMEAAGETGVSPYHLASRIKQETGCDILNNTSICGNISGYMGYYNYYNIGATGDNPSINGIAYARSREWTSPELSIKGGASFIGDKYISKGQYTLYLEKFNVNDASSYALHTHQYMQNITAPAAEASNIYLAYKGMGLLDISFNFVIPVYNNMTENRTDIYSLNVNDFIPDSTKVYANVSGNLNVRSGPGSGYSLITKVDSSEIMTRIYRGNQSGERWDKVRLANMTEGYVFSSYIEECNYTKVSGVSIIANRSEMIVGEKQILVAGILPDNATYKEVHWKSSDEGILTVSDSGEVTAIKAGEAVITVITEDQLKQSSMGIKVRTLNSRVEFDKKEYVLIKGGECEYNILISDTDNNNCDISIEDTSIVNITNGKIVGILGGQTKIYVTLQGTDITAEANVRVVDLGENTVNLDESISLDGNEIKGIIPGETVKNIIGKITTNLALEFKNLNNEGLGATDKVGTGNKVVFRDELANEIYSYFFVIYGDVSGEGVIDSLDILKLRQHLLGAYSLTGYLYKAANISRDITNTVDSLDILRLRQYLLGIRNIEQ